MAEAKATKNIEIDVSFRNPEELKAIFASIFKLYTMGVNNYKQNQNDSFFEYSVRHQLEDLPEHRFEELNGQQCIIIQSKINQ